MSAASLYAIGGDEYHPSTYAPPSRRSVEILEAAIHWMMFHGRDVRSATRRDLQRVCEMIVKRNLRRARRMPGKDCSPESRKPTLAPNNSTASTVTRKSVGSDVGRRLVCVQSMPRYAGLSSRANSSAAGWTITSPLSGRPPRSLLAGNPQGPRAKTKKESKPAEAPVREREPDRNDAKSEEIARDLVEQSASPVGV